MAAGRPGPHRGETKTASTRRTISDPRNKSEAACWTGLHRVRKVGPITYVASFIGSIRHKARRRHWKRENRAGRKPSEDEISRFPTIFESSSMEINGGGWKAGTVNGWGMVQACAAEFPLDPIGRYVLCTCAQNHPHHRPQA
jgi:hypothetical protein